MIKNKVKIIAFGIAITILSSFSNVYADNQSLAKKILHKFYQMSSLQADFEQIGPNGERAFGQLYLERPLKIRFSYINSPLEIICDGSSLAVHNRQLNSWDLYNVSQTPFKYLINQDINGLLKKVSKIIQTKNDIILDIDEKDSAIGSLTLYFDKHNNQLKKWIVIDRQKLKTQVLLSNITDHDKFDPSLFAIPYQDIAMQRKDR